MSRKKPYCGINFVKTDNLWWGKETPKWVETDKEWIFSFMREIYPNEDETQLDTKLIINEKALSKIFYYACGTPKNDGEFTDVTALCRINFWYDWLIKNDYKCIFTLSYVLDEE